MPVLNDLSADLLIHIETFLNVRDGCRLGTCNRRFAYLRHVYATQRAGPQLAAAAKPTHFSKSLLRTCLDQLSGARPNLSLQFGLRAPNKGSVQLPGAHVLGVGGDRTPIQTNLKGSGVRSDFKSAMLLGSFPQVTLSPFRIGIKIEDTCGGYTTQNFLRDLQASGTDWKVFLVYVCGSGYYHIEEFVKKLQSTYPNATIIGGICDACWVSSGFGTGPLRTTDGSQKLLSLTDGIFGMAMGGGDVPVRSIVSRGVSSDLPEHAAYTVAESTLIQRDEDDYPFSGDADLLKPVHRIEKLRCCVTGQVMDPSRLLETLQADDDPEFLGLERPGEDGFTLHPLHPYTLHRSYIVTMTDGTQEQAASLENARIEFFSMDTKMSLSHMDRTVECLKQATRDEVILGGLLVSCNGRGPSARSMLGEEMADATRLAKAFPDVPICGIYAGGEIGPMAKVGGVNHNAVFRSGRASVQGFTAVVALFIVPPPNANKHVAMDDGDASVRSYMLGKVKKDK